MKKLTYLAAVAALALSTTGCRSRDEEKLAPSRDLRATDRASDDLQAAKAQAIDPAPANGSILDSLRPDVAGVPASERADRVQRAKERFQGTRDQVVAGARTSLTEMDGKVQQLEVGYGRHTDLAAADRQRADSLLVQLRTARDRGSEALDRLSSASETTWESARDEAVAAFNALDDAYDDAAKLIR